MQRSADRVIAGPGLAERLAREAYRLARSGVRPEDPPNLRTTGAAADLAADLAAVMAPPERHRGYRLVSGLLDGFGDPGSTPEHWKDDQNADAAAIDMAIMLAASAMGDVFGWAEQQDGRLVHNILPIRGQETLQVGAGSVEPLARHTEDAFHPGRPHILMLVCMRNPESVGTSVASVRRTGLTDAEYAQLERPLVAITPDDSYGAPNTAHRWLDREARGVATVWWADDGPCLRYDPVYSRVLTDDPAFLDAYAALGTRLVECEAELPLTPGDIVLVDNDVAVHSRRSFRPSYDGTDRWLKRTIIRLDRPRPAGEAAEDGFGQRAVEPGRGR
ncbi:alpha-ketoglutarate-dependent taurine dioxygenase [Murinocardiopsis flavida]|uniref:Alpha-ketoglutarate-dependent taurine dioxygenase n=1 Tax=Murinocardiopsis flavida TaxID=645275 RepID=A0A2P8D564_9ACTN|nr:TauD/TfdA family dioxygenase [Murinocardiopsis flavida]PSK92348.1 alpha-ketoglutarate-dependent taurine dioxygenase [Murinocardiopsis flavida]